MILEAILSILGLFAATILLIMIIANEVEYSKIQMGIYKVKSCDIENSYILKVIGDGTQSLYSAVLMEIDGKIFVGSECGELEIVTMRIGNENVVLNDENVKRLLQHEKCSDHASAYREICFSTHQLQEQFMSETADKLQDCLYEYFGFTVDNFINEKECENA